MTTTELILICALLAWMGIALGIVVLLDVALSRTRMWRSRALRSRASREQRSELASPQLHAD